MDAVLDGSYPDIPSHNGGWIVLLQKLPFLRLLYTQFFKGGALAFGGDAQESVPAAEGDYRGSLSPLLDRLSTESRAHGVKLILAYHPALLPEADGSVSPDTDPEKLAAFRELCAEKDIVFVDLTERFLASFAEESVFANGFSNTAPGSGHLNRVGHRLFAEGVYAALRDGEG